jgi:hypothetical protein
MSKQMSPSRSTLGTAETKRFSIFAPQARKSSVALEIAAKQSSDDSDSDDESESAIDAELRLRKYVEPFNHAVMMVRAAYLELFTVLFLDKDDEMSMELLSQYDADIWFARSLARSLACSLSLSSCRRLEHRASDDAVCHRFDYEDESITTFIEDESSEPRNPPLSLMRILVAELESAAVQVNLDGPASVRPEVLMYLRTALMPVVIAYLSMRQMWATGDSRVIRAKRMLVARLIVAMQVGRSVMLA